MSHIRTALSDLMSYFQATWKSLLFSTALLGLLSGFCSVIVFSLLAGQRHFIQSAHQEGFEVILSGSVQKEDRDGLILEIQKMPWIATANLVPQDQIEMNLKTILTQLAPDLAEDPEVLELAPQSVEIRLNDLAKRADFSAPLISWIDDLRQNAAVGIISFAQEQQLALLKGLDKFNWVLFFLLILSTGFFFFHLMSLLQRITFEFRRELKLKTLFGASPLQIIGPFLMLGFSIGLLSSFVSVFSTIAICNFVHWNLGVAIPTYSLVSLSVVVLLQSALGSLAVPIVFLASRPLREVLTRG